MAQEIGESTQGGERSRNELDRADDPSSHIPPAGLAAFPPPEFLESYQRIDPKFATRLLLMAEIEQKNAFQLEKMAIEGPLELARRGQVFAIASVGLILAFCTLLALIGFVVASAVVAAFDLVGLVVVFVTGQRGHVPSNTRQLESARPAEQ